MKESTVGFKHVVLVVAILTLLLFSMGSAAEKGEKEKIALDQSEEVLKQYIDSFTKTGIPTPKAVEAAIKKAQLSSTIKAWEDVAAIANSYANVIDVLSDHYAKLYYASRSGGSGNYSYISKAADYEKIRNRYLKSRNDAYIELSKLYLSKGDRAKALSYVVSAVKLSGAEPNMAGEDLIKKIIEYSE